MDTLLERLKVTNMQIRRNTSPDVPMIDRGVSHTRTIVRLSAAEMGRAGRTSRDWMLCPVTPWGKGNLRNFSTAPALNKAGYIQEERPP
jgi:hypothetical protein